MRVHEFESDLNIPLKPYALMDKMLLHYNKENFVFQLSVPTFSSVVLGCSNKVNISVNEDNIIKDNIPLFKRPTGGEAIYLSSNSLIISIVKGFGKRPSPKQFFKMYTNLIIKALNSLGIKGLSWEGTSDICINKKKILGSGIYISKNCIFYHAVLNLNESPEIIAKYLKHPPREPHYRQHRSHRDFITSIAKEGYSFSYRDIINQLELNLNTLNA